MGRNKIPAASGDEKRPRINAKQGAREYAKDKAGGTDFYCTTCLAYFPMSALDAHAGH